MSAPGRVLLSYRINPPQPKLGEARERQAQPHSASRPGIENREMTGCLANSGAQTESTSSLKNHTGGQPQGRGSRCHKQHPSRGIDPPLSIGRAHPPQSDELLIRPLLWRAVFYYNDSLDSQGIDLPETPGAL